MSWWPISSDLHHGFQLETTIWDVWCWSNCPTSLGQFFFALWWILDASEPAASNWVSSRGLMPKTLNHSPNLLIWFWKKDAVRCSHFLKRCHKRAATTSQQLVWLVWIKSGCQVVTATACDTYGMFSTVLNELRWQLKLHTLVTCLDFGAELSFTWAKASPAARQDRFTMDHHGSHHPRGFPVFVLDIFRWHCTCTDIVVHLILYL